MRSLNARQWTLILSVTLALVATTLTMFTSDGVILVLHWPSWVTAVALGLTFLFAEQFLMNAEFRRQAHSVTLAGVPLFAGVLVLSPVTLVITRICGSVIAFGWQRVTIDKVFYNTAGYAFEAALDVTAIHAFFGQNVHLDQWAALSLVVIVAVVDQVMSLLVLLLIRLHNGPVSRADVLGILAPSLVLSVVASLFATAILLLMRQGILGVALVLVLLGCGAAAYQGYATARRRHQALTLVHEFVTDAVGAASLETLAQELLTRIRKLLRATTAEVMIIDAFANHHADAPRQHALVLTIDEDDHLTVCHRGVNYTDWIEVRALTQEQPMLAARTTKDAGIRGWLADRGLRDALLVALPKSSGLVGTILLTDRLGDTATFTNDDLTLLRTLTGHLAVALHSTRLVEQLSYDATHDSLTGLANRTHLINQIDRELSRPDHELAVLLLDVDRFKEVNDALGHGVGDRLLTVIGQRLRDALPPSATVARLGGDEFAVLLPEPPASEQDLTVLAVNLANAIALPVHFDEALLTPETSIGVARTTTACPQTELLRQADTAMYDAKSTGRGVAIYTPDMDRGRVERLALLADLRTALTDQPEQFAVFFQPKIDIRSGAVVGAEALVRWHHPSRGTVVPDVFIPLAESSGLISKLTPIVLKMAVAECATWNVPGAALTVAVNLSTKNISDPGLVEDVCHTLRAAGLPSERLILEITESRVMDDPAQTLPVLQRLHDSGICLSLDDFGTGYSSLAYLQQLPVKELKIDQSFVRGLKAVGINNNQSLIRTIAALGSSLGLRIVAEGVEDARTLAELRDLGCEIAQGYHIGKPIPAAEFRTWLFQQPITSSPHLRILQGSAEDPYQPLHHAL